MTEQASTAAPAPASQPKDHSLWTRQIRAIYDDNTIRVYQAFNRQIAQEAVRLQHFGPSFSMTRMSWIKPSFLWMMYRSGWATKENQEHILAIDIKIEGFKQMLAAAVPSTFQAHLYASQEEWKKVLTESQVRVQWDPERDIYGAPCTNVRSLQLGLRGDMLQRYNSEWMVRITDITDFVHQQKQLIDDGQVDSLSLPEEQLFTVD